MGNSKIFYYPASREVSGLQTIDFGETISDLQISPYRITADAVSIGGRFSRIARRSGMRVRIIHERFTDQSLARALYSLQSHLFSGGALSFAVDDTNTYAAFYTGGAAIFSGARPTYPMQPELFKAYGTTTPVNGDVLHVESFGAGARYEETTVHTFSGRNMQLGADLKYDHGTPFMIRQRDFFPALFLTDTSAPILTDDRRISFTLDMTLECYPAHTRALLSSAGSDGLPIGGTLDAPSKTDLDEAVFGPLGPGISAGGVSLPKRPTLDGPERLAGPGPLEEAMRKIDLLG